MRVVLCACMALSSLVVSADADDAPAKATGTVVGRVVYQADPDKPWRYARFYVNPKNSNSLAESVVALQGSELKKVRATEKPTTVEVDQRDFMFVPETTAIRAGDSVKFLNNDGPTHNVRAAHDLASFNESMPAGGEYVHLFKKPTGSVSPITLGCVYHGNMRAWIYVFENPFFKVTDATGTFRFEQVPVGNHRLDAVHPAGQLRWSKRVDVKSGETLRVDIVLTPELKLP